MEAALSEARARGADTMDIGVDEPDLVARRSTRASASPTGPTEQAAR